jgi:DNA-binding NtrC family response regulator
MFGHTKGAFTGASADKAGHFELADGGTLFLDEIADLSKDAQAKLLRVLETRTFRRVGGAKELSPKVRVIAATNRPLADQVERGEFRRDLLYRLNVFAIDLDPLRDRADDILPLAEHFLAAYGTPRGVESEGLSSEAGDALQAYPFPGNARELRNIVERAAILCRSGRVEVEHLSLPEAVATPADPEPHRGNGNLERDQILRTLEGTRWNRRQAAKELGMPYSTLRYKMDKLNIS